MIVQDVPLLFENSLESLFPTVILAYVPAEVQVERLVTGRGFAPERARSVIAAQMPIEAKRGRAQYVINNSGSRDDTRGQVQAVWRELKA